MRRGGFSRGIDGFISVVIYREIFINEHTMLFVFVERKRNE